MKKKKLSLPLCHRCLLTGIFKFYLSFGFLRDRGVGLVFMTSAVLLILTSAHFVVGVFGQKLSCDVLAKMGTETDEPQQRELYDFIDRQLPLTALNPHGVVKDDLVTVSNIIKYSNPTFLFPFSLAPSFLIGILLLRPLLLLLSCNSRECHQNKTLYQMLKLERVLNVSSLGDQARRFNIEAEVRRLSAGVRFDRTMTLLTPEAKQQLRDFAASDIMRVNFTAYSVLVNHITRSSIQKKRGVKKKDDLNLNKIPARRFLSFFFTSHKIGSFFFKAGNLRLGFLFFFFPLCPSHPSGHPSIRPTGWPLLQALIDLCGALF